MGASEQKTFRHLLFAFLALAAVMSIGTLGYHWLGDGRHSWLDCFYMTFITFTTIGYSEVVDVTAHEYGRLFTIFIGITGIGVLGYVLSTVTAFMLENDINSSWRRRKMKQRIAQLKDHYIVCGIGMVGFNVANELNLSGRTCVIVDANMAAIHHYLEKNPDQLWLHGDATTDEVLLAAGVNNAHGVFAVAHDDNMNLVISLSAKQLNPSLRVVARCHELKNIEKTRRAGADEVISPDFTGGQRLVSAMVRPKVSTFLDEMLKSEDGVRFEEVVVPASMEGKPLSSLYEGHQDGLVLALQHKGRWQFNPASHQQLHGGDMLMVMATADGRQQLERLLLGNA